MIEMSVAGIALDARNGHPIVVLNDNSKRRALPIWVGMAEANAIARALDSRKPERPLTHDLLLNVITELGYTVKEININELSSSTYFATVILSHPGSEGNPSFEKPVDARPSDAIALALRSNSPIFVSEQVVADGTIPTDYEKDEQETQQFKKFINSLKASDFIKPDEPGASEKH